MRHILIAMAASLALSACAAPDYMSKHYDGPTMIPKMVTTKDGEFKVFENKKENRLLISPTLGEGFMHGTPPMPEARAAAVAWLKKSGLQCHITDGYLVTDPIYEFLYTCGR